MTRSLTPPRTHTRRSRALRCAGVAVAAVSLTVSGALPAAAHGGGEDHHQKLQRGYDQAANVPPITSPNVDFVSTFPETAAISGCFAKTAEYFYVSSLDSLSVFDTSQPRQPQLRGTLDNLTFENEAMNCGERRVDGRTKRFVLIGVDLHQASTGDPQHVNSGDGQELVLVDVTDPTSPRIRSRAPATTSTHTVACVDDTNCRYAYSAGNDGDNGTGTFSIFDLTNLDRPREVDSRPGTNRIDPFRSPTAAHKWNFDSAGFGTHTGYDGSSMFDVSRPRHPRLVTTTGRAGQGTSPTAQGYNDFIHHNSFRPNARAFRPNTAPSYANGNVQLITEEDYLETDCSKAGSFQAWHVKSLSGAPGAIVPLDKVELADLGNFPLPQDAFCSAHWFDYHKSGIVAVGYYGGGLQLVDARNPRQLKPYGHATFGLSEVWDAYWVPKSDRQGRPTAAKTNIVYTVDLVRGLDVFEVDLPGAGTAASAQPAATGGIQLASAGTTGGATGSTTATGSTAVTSPYAAMVDGLSGLLRSLGAAR